MTEMADKLYKALFDLIVGEGGDFEHVKHTGFMDFLVTGSDVNRALDVMKEYDSKRGQYEQQGNK